MRKIKIVIGVAALMISLSAQSSENPDIAALRALDQAYATHWVDGDAEGVIALFTEDATLVPHHGDSPIKGRDAIRDFWFNPVYSPTIIREWRREAAEIFRSGEMGIVRGRARLVWEYDGTQTTIPDSNYVMLAVLQDGAWRIRLLTWNDDPRDWIQKTVD